MDRDHPRIGPLKEHIDRICKPTSGAPRKQRHTAHRIYTRLREEHPEHPISEPTVRRYVAVRKRELGLSGREVFVPQSYQPGQEAQVDWFEATAKLSGERCLLQFFAMRSMASGDAFHRAYTNATQQAFLEGHEHAFAYFGGVFRTLRYDNLTMAVKKILRGYRREETEPGNRVPFALGLSAVSTATRLAATKRAASKAKSGGTGGTGWYRCRRRRIWPR